MLGRVAGLVLGDDAEFTHLVRGVLCGSVLLPGTHGEIPGVEGRDLALARECVQVPWLLLEDVQGQR